ncbi:MAG TPA: amidohydrolase [Methanothermococcus okinawensis]|uniref:Amidohydrolase n=1 Tax=Methanothermococcus okinawensis TaxID=155863 RepID=A0A833DZJ1_9EURY|nr:amidohydrolase [Methanothermococcus okinawensis]HIP91489.1 amidohydrolase [Methanothermococcus okinawensis]
MDILIKDLDYAVDLNLNLYRDIDILLRRGDKGEITIHRGRNLMEKFNLDRRDLKIIEGNRRCAIPGLSNNHTHIPMTLLRGIADDMILQDWLESRIWPNESKLTGEDVYYGALLGCLEMLRFGVTSFNDMYFFPEEIVKGAKEIGIKGAVGFPVIDFGTPQYKDLDKLLRACEEFIKRYLREEKIRPVVAPHAPYTCSRDTYVQCKEISQEYNVPLHTHLSETRYEVVEMENKIGRRPVEYLESIGVLGENLIAAHCVWVTKEEVKKLGRYRVKVVHCPGSNMKLASGGVMPLVEMLKEGVSLSLGTDGPASNNNLDILEEMKICALLHKAHRWDPRVGDVDTVLSMALNSKSIGFENRDVVLLDLKSPHLRPVHNIKSNIVYSANGNDVDTVIVDGEVLLENKRFSRIGDRDLERIYTKVDRVVKKFEVQ